ncbi:hypothetical protein Glove_71g190 [Diversispora epigaea]|uniref:Uncharacterized protein n=1 Tax=Diversispora epigaea TaxID=1348612 RepID=A0A397JD61_9GLOM|nr:hypothetical protein Glove_71g190 [Diversispora epigaea]
MDLLNSLIQKDDIVGIGNIKNQLKFRSKNSISIYGITKNPTEDEYMMVMNYAEYDSLRKVLNNELENFQPNENNINKPNVSAKILMLFYKNIEIRFIFDLMLAAKKFELEELSNKLETFLTETKAS